MILWLLCWYDWNSTWNVYKTVNYIKWQSPNCFINFLEKSFKIPKWSVHVLQISHNYTESMCVIPLCSEELNNKILMRKCRSALTPWGLVTNIEASEIITGSGIGLAPSHHNNLCWLTVNWTLQNKRQRNLNQNASNFFQENTFENIICESQIFLQVPMC